VSFGCNFLTFINITPNIYPVIGYSVYCSLPLPLVGILSGDISGNFTVHTVQNLSLVIKQINKITEFEFL
jgi:hypothetical protein